MSQPILWAALALLIALSAIVAIAQLIDAHESGRPPAEPGTWFGNYHLAWSIAFPGAWERGEQKSGSFYKGDVWGSSTLEWDRDWFHNNGMSMPKRTVFVEPKPPKPNEFRIGTLGPGESVSFPVVITGNEDGLA